MSEIRGLREILARGAVRVPVAAGRLQAELKPAGATVRRGEALADVPQSAPAVLTPITGTVGGPTPVRLTSDQEVIAVPVEPLAESGPVTTPEPTATAADGAGRIHQLLKSIGRTDLSRVSDSLRVAGVWADRWASPDLLGQLQQCLKRPVDTVVCTALDFDAALPLQQSVTCTHALEVVAAVAVLGAVTGATRASIVVDAATEDACRRAIERWSPQTGVRAVALRNHYPQPNPTLLLHTLAGRALRPGRLPTEAGALVLDAVAAAAVGRCLLYGEPALRTPIGVADMRGAGSAGAASHLLMVPIGMSAVDVLREAGLARGAFELRGGSPLREVRPGPDAVISAGGEVALYLVAPQPTPNPDPCIRCGWCVSSCPVHIQPAGILQAAQFSDPIAAERHGIESCIECGVCSYVCPSRLPLLAGIRSVRRTGSHA